MTQLATHVAIFNRVRAEIAEVYGMDEDDQAVIDTAEGETDLHDYLANLLREARVAEAQAKGIASVLKEMQERKARLEAKKDRLRAIVLHAMADAGLPKLTAPDFAASRSKSPPQVVLTADVSQLPDEWCRISREADKARIKEALKAGTALPFATLSNGGETLTVRTA